jgi:hypothetical protein
MRDIPPVACRLAALCLALGRGWTEHNEGSSVDPVQQVEGATLSAGESLAYQLAGMEP